MPKKSAWTPEKRKAFGEKMKAAKAAKETKTPKQPIEEPSERSSIIETKEDTISIDDYAALLKEVLELKAQMNRQATQDERVRLQGGKLVGSVEKYDLTPSLYPDPVERLSKESRLARFAFTENYLLDFNVSVSEYTTIDNIRTKEPKFTLVLAAYMYDDESGEQKFEDNGQPSAYVVRRLIMHEDPEAALVIAREQNLEVDEENEEAFLNEMRYIRMRDFLLECFFPTPPKQMNRKNEIVVGGKIVETFQVTSEGEKPHESEFSKLANPQKQGYL